MRKHLRVLERAELVRARKAGRRRLYELDAAPLARVDEWVSRFRLFWAARLISLKDHLEAPVDPAAGLAPNPTPELAAPPPPAEGAAL